MKVVVPILMLAMLAQTFTQGFYYLGYKINRSAFEKNCINKAKSWLHCNGKCQLMKKIIESEKKEQQAPEMKLAGKPVVLFVNRIIYVDPFLSKQKTDFTFSTTPVYKSDFLQRIFHPPTV